MRLFVQISCSVAATAVGFAPRSFLYAGTTMTASDPPVISGVPGPATAQCGQVPDPATPTAKDACGDATRTGLRRS